MECKCDARLSGVDEGEYCARGCPSCICVPDKHKWWHMFFMRWVNSYQLTETSFAPGALPEIKEWYDDHYCYICREIHRTDYLKVPRRVK